jgi:hypothetical protein
MYISSLTRIALIGAFFLSLTGISPVQAANPTEDGARQAINISPTLLTGAITLFGTLAISGLIAIKQDEQAELKDCSSLAKLVNWYQRVFCGQVSKKYKKLQSDNSLKNAYTPKSGVMGTVLSTYNKHIKDIEVAFGLAAIPTLLLVGGLRLNTVLGILAGFAKGGPGSEIVTA